MTEQRPEKKVIVIPAKEETLQEQAKKRNLRVAAYCRVSTNSDEQLSSYENQKAFYTEKIMKNPDWTMTDIFADEGKTGTSTCKRKEFLRMIRQCRQGKIDLILAKSVSRFARNTVDTLQFTRELRGLGIGVFFEEQNINSIYPESEFLIALHGAFAQSESETISENVRWGKQQAMREGKATIFYPSLLGYKKGEDGKPVIVPEDAETIRYIYKSYLAGKSLRSICDELTAGGYRNASGMVNWLAPTIKSILTNEKYCGDVLMQKTFIDNCISKKAIPNTGQRPMYLIQNHHEGIVSREIFDAVQLEIARRRAQSGRTKKSAPSGCGHYSSKYALSGLLFCGGCGSAYRRVTWIQHGMKRIVWRCTSRVDYGKKYCTDAPTLDEGPLQEAILNAVNSVMTRHGPMVGTLMDSMVQEFTPTFGENMSLGNLDRAMERLGGQFNQLLSEAANSENLEDYTEQFRSISDSMAELKRRKAHIESFRQEHEQADDRARAMMPVLEGLSSRLTEWNEEIMYQLLEKVTVLSRVRIRVTLRDGQEIEQAVNQPKRRVVV